jgi:HAD superfamily hydrolase (TIGR01549 family)
MIVRGVIFDMDGTLTRPYLDFRALRDRLGVGEVDLIAYLAEAPAWERERVETILAEFEQDGVEHAELNPGALELLDALRQRGMPTGLLTRNSRRSVEAVCRKFGLVFDAVFTRNDAPSKPSPEPVWRMASAWGLNPSEILVVGDFKWDMVCAHNAGARSVWLSNGDAMPSWAGEADHTIHSLSALLDIIDASEPAGLTGGTPR